MPNPVCSAVGCGEWKRPRMANPAYKGPWTAPVIKNPQYAGDYRDDDHDNCSDGRAHPTPTSLL